MSAASSSSGFGSAVVRAVLVGGLLAGAGDLAFALIYYGSQGAKAVRVLQTIAAGVLGRQQAFAGGVGAAALGVVLHFVIALGAAAVFVVAARAWPALQRRTILAGLVFGAGVWLVMNTVIVPLSALPRGPFPRPAGRRCWVRIFCWSVCPSPGQRAAIWEPVADEETDQGRAAANVHTQATLPESG